MMSRLMTGFATKRLRECFCLKLQTCTRRRHRRYESWSDGWMDGLVGWLVCWLAKIDCARAEGPEWLKNGHKVFRKNKRAHQGCNHSPFLVVG